MKKILNILKRDMYFEFIGVVIGIMIGIITYVKLNNMIISVIVGLILCLILAFVINRLCLMYIVKSVANSQIKDKYLDPNNIRGLDSQVDEIMDLDKELIDFLDKYSSDKYIDLEEKELNKQWAIKGKYFIEKADKLFLAMNNEQLLESLLATEQICHIVDIFKYFEPFLINVDYLLEHPDDLIEAYYLTLSNYNSLEKYSINQYYLNKIKEKNYFEEIERFILSNMTNDQIMELANNSNDWYKKLYFYGYLKHKKRNNK